jgi:hypothetical protein
MDEKYGIVLTFLFKKEKYGNNRKREKLGKNTKKKKYQSTTTTNRPPTLLATNCVNAIVAPRSRLCLTPPLPLPQQRTLQKHLNQ